jgi:hypothetical protein
MEPNGTPTEGTTQNAPVAITVLWDEKAQGVMGVKAPPDKIKSLQMVKAILQMGIENVELRIKMSKMAAVQREEALKPRIATGR